MCSNGLERCRIPNRNNYVIVGHDKIACPKLGGGVEECIRGLNEDMTDDQTLRMANGLMEAHGKAFHATFGKGLPWKHG